MPRRSRGCRSHDADEGPPDCFRIDEPDAALALVARSRSRPTASTPSGSTKPARRARRRGAAARSACRSITSATGSASSASSRSRRPASSSRCCSMPRAASSASCASTRIAGSSCRRPCAQRLERARRSDVRRQRERHRAVARRGAGDPRARRRRRARSTTAPAWRRSPSGSAAATRLRPKPPAALKATLRDYQIEGHAWLARLAAWGAGACLADDMGLGKTVQAIAVLLDRAKLGPALVLAPTSVALNWVDELARFAPTLRPSCTARRRDRAATLAALGKKRRR